MTNVNNFALESEFTPFLLQQTGIRASFLFRRFGSNSADWEDLQQDLALDCLQRLPTFDPSRSTWQQFVSGVVRNHAMKLAKQRMARPELFPLDETNQLSAARTEPATVNGSSILDRHLDVSRVLAKLPADLQLIARRLSRLPVSRVRQMSGLSPTLFERKLQVIRRAFLAAGIDSAFDPRPGGAR